MPPFRLQSPLVVYLVSQQIRLWVICIDLSAHPFKLNCLPFTLHHRFLFIMMFWCAMIVLPYYFYNLKFVIHLLYIYFTVVTENLWRSEDHFLEYFFYHKDSKASSHQVWWQVPSMMSRLTGKVKSLVHLTGDFNYNFKLT